MRAMRGGWGRLVLWWAFWCVWVAPAAAAGWPALESVELPQLGGGQRDAAVLIGIDDYPFLDPVAGAEANITAWERFLVQSRQLPYERVRRLAGKWVDRAQVEAALKSAAGQVQKGGTLYVVFVGHGAPAKGPRGAMEPHLLLGNTSPNLQSFSTAGLPVSRIAKLTQGAQKRGAKVVAVLDACFTGKGQGGTQLIAGAQFAVLGQLAALPKVTMLTAASAQDITGPLPGASRPAFSYLVLGALLGWGDRDGDGVVTAQEAVSFAGAVMLDAQRAERPALEGANVPLSQFKKGAQWAVPAYRGWLNARPGAGAGARVGGSVRSAASACTAGSLEACYQQGREYEQGKGVKKNTKRAAAIYAQVCEGGHLMGCRRLGMLYRAGEGVKKDPQRAAKLYRQACEGGEVRGCSSLGILYEYGEGVAKDEAKALQLYRQACEGQYNVGCAYEGTIYEYGRIVPQDLKKAVALYKRSCDEGSMTGCSYLGTMYQTGKGVRKDLARAAKLQAQACEGEQGAACRRLGLQYEHGDGVRADHARAAENYRKGCDLEDMRSCAYLGVMYRSGLGVEKDYEQAFTLNQRACKGGEAQGCTNLGVLYEYGEGVRQDEGEALRRYQSGCKADLMTACAYLGTMYEHGKAVSKDTSYAVTLYRRACDGDSPAGCYYLGAMYEWGEGVKKNTAQARTLYRRACDDGHKRACDKLN